MSAPIITVENLGKKYRLTHQAERQRYTALRDVISEKAKRLFRGGPAVRPAELSRDQRRAEDFWALKGVSFEIRQGDVTGIIGRNGAGKSTLLKVLSRITEPTEGRVRVRGRVASLLEVGTGFHPELTGRENIYLNGAILGMRKAEIKQKFDEIVAFAGVEKFLDTPVKRYSSGMYVRLAFGVAAHLETEILVVDEVLAVGDAHFQEKCLGKMGEFSQSGRTVIFVSHNLAAIQQLTKSCLVFAEGRVIFSGPTANAVDEYVEDSQRTSSGIYDVSNKPRPFPSHSRKVEFTRLWLPESANGMFGATEDIRIHARLFGRERVHRFRLSFTVFRSDGTPVGSGFSESLHSIDAGEAQEVELKIGNHKLAPGRYHLGIATGTGNHRTGHVDFDIVLDVCHFEVLPPPGENGTMSQWTSGWGSIRFESITTSRMEPLECASRN